MDIDSQYNQNVKLIAHNLTGAEIDTLVALIEHGPIEDGDVPSKSARNDLIVKGLAFKCVANGEDGYQAATYLGKDVYKAKFNGSTIKEAMIIRKMLLAEV